MKRIFVFILITVGLTAQAQVKSFGKKINQEGALNAQQLITELGDRKAIPIKVQGTVQEVCQAKGCWMTMELGQDKSMRITFKDYGFFVPLNSSGKTAVIQGELKKEITTVATLKHYAKDAGKSHEEIEAITEPKTELVFTADGVLFLD